MIEDTSSMDRPIASGRGTRAVWFAAIGGGVLVVLGVVLAPSVLRWMHAKPEQVVVIDQAANRTLFGGANSVGRTVRIDTRDYEVVGVIAPWNPAFLMVERLTAELRRQEVAVWKKAIRVINHELNNSIAPISSLFHSAKLAQGKPERRDRLEEIYETIEERLAFLRAFFDSYARFARLPPPSRERVRWNDLLADVRALYRVRLEGDASGEAFIDPTQVRQVLINLLRRTSCRPSLPAGRLRAWS